MIGRCRIDGNRKTPFSDASHAIRCLISPADRFARRLDVQVDGSTAIPIVDDAHHFAV